MAKGPKDTFNVQSGLCRTSGGDIALNASAPEQTQQAFFTDQLIGGSDVKIAAAGEKLPVCKAPVVTSNVKYDGPR